MRPVPTLTRSVVPQAAVVRCKFRGMRLRPRPHHLQLDGPELTPRPMADDTQLTLDDDGREVVEASSVSPVNIG